jgi:lysozyme
MAEPTTKAAAKGALAGVAAMLAIATPFVAGWEGTKTKPYYDPFGKVWTVCTGETNVPMREYTVAECNAMFGKSFLTYARQVANLSPGIEGSPYEWAAHSSLAYNAGVTSYAKSSVRRLFLAGRGVEACRAIRLYRMSGGKVLPGLVYRREGEGGRVGEYELCLAGAVPKVFPL